MSPAELRLLHFLPTHLSFREIAEELFVSANTVKTQARSIYRKLGVSSRAEAVACARTAGLLEAAASPVEPGPDRTDRFHPDRVMRRRRSDDWIQRHDEEAGMSTEQDITELSSKIGGRWLIEGAPDNEIPDDGDGAARRRCG